MRPVDQEGPLHVVLEGHLTLTMLNDALSMAGERLTAGSRGLIVDCTTMTGYTPEARSLFVDWNREHKSALTHVAILTGRPLWRLVVSAMSLASTQKMRAFESVDDARRWIGGGTKR